MYRTLSSFIWTLWEYLLLKDVQALGRGLKNLWAVKFQSLSGFVLIVLQDRVHNREINVCSSNVIGPVRLYLSVQEGSGQELHANFKLTPVMVMVMVLVITLVITTDVEHYWEVQVGCPNPTPMTRPHTTRAKEGLVGATYFVFHQVH